MCNWNKEIDLDEELAKNEDEEKAMEEAKAAEAEAGGKNIGAIAPTPFTSLAPNATMNATDRALAADGPSIEESKKDEDGNDWAVEDAKKVTGEVKETVGTFDKQNSKSLNGVDN